MAEAPIRIALLGRAGEAREQLRRALLELGAELVAEGDPAELEPDALLALRPKVVLISLEPAIEEALDRYAAVLAAPDIEVMFDEAEVTRQLQGWDLARWARHLAAKLVGGDVLPPLPEGAERLAEADLQPQPGAPPTPAQLMDGARLEDYLVEADGLADAVPAEASLAVGGPVDPPAAVDTATPAPEGIELAIDVDLSQLEQALSSEPAPVAAAPEASAVSSIDLDAELPTGSFGELAAASEPAESLDFSLDVDLDGLDRALAQDAPPQAEAEASAEAGDGLLVDIDFDSDTPVSFSSLAGDEEPAAGDLDTDVAALAAQLEQSGEGMAGLAADPLGLEEAPAEISALPSLDGDLGMDLTGASDIAPDNDLPDLGELDLPGELAMPDSAPASMSEPLVTTLPDLDFAMPATPDPAPEPAGLGLTLEESPVAASAAAPSPAAVKPAGGMFAGLTLSLVDDESAVATAAPAPAVSGLVLALAGIGGPDAIRQLLRALPATLPVPVLIHQHLDNGRYEKLAEQLAKASALPLALAEAGQPLRPGHVALLPQGLGIKADGHGFRFAPVAGVADLLAALPAAKCALLALSGAPAELVPAICEIAARGGLVLAQSPEGVFDTAAIDALVAAGQPSANPGELALQLSLRWNA